MCHAFLTDSRFYRFLFRIDLDIAAEVQWGGCLHCNGSLHVSSYPRKPRGIRFVPDESYESRLSFCCAEDGCRRRCTPPSVRFLGKKVFLGVIVVLVTAMEHGLTPKRRRQLTEEPGPSPQTISHWRSWWPETFHDSSRWHADKRAVTPQTEPAATSVDLLSGSYGSALLLRLCRLLLLLAPFTTTSWSGSLRVVIDPQKM